MRRPIWLPPTRAPSCLALQALAAAAAAAVGAAEWLPDCITVAEGSKGPVAKVCAYALASVVAVVLMAVCVVGGKGKGKVAEAEGLQKRRLQRPWV